MSGTGELFLPGGMLCTEPVGQQITGSLHPGYGSDS